MSCAICQTTSSVRYQCCPSEQHRFCESCCANIVSSLISNGKIALLFDRKVPCYVCNEKFQYDRLPARVQTDLHHILSTIPTASTAPEAIKDFNYYYNQSNQLRHCVTQKKFIFIAQRHYELLGNAVERHIQSLMKSVPWNYEEIWLPMEGRQQKVNIFVSKDFRTNANGCLILIQGCGVVRPGQWSRSCCINESLDIGAMFSYMFKARERNLSVIILNPNQTHYTDEEPIADIEAATSEEDLRSFYLSSEPLPRLATNPIPSLSTSRHHVLYVYDHIISRFCPAQRFYYVAHSAGGAHLMSLFRERWDSISSRPAKIAFIDSLHCLSPLDTAETRNFLGRHAIHFVASKEPLGQAVNLSENSICAEVSAGHAKHEYTSGSCVNSVFDFFL